MTVAELIAQLEEMPQDFEIVLENYCCDWVEPNPTVIRDNIVML